MSAPRLDIQGLRALAVTLVVIFHLDPEVLSGGYIGVDVFFVISGFLITGHLLREAERTGGVNIGTFWARRARRLLPAALLVLAVSAVAAATLMPRSTVETNLWEILFAALYGLNWALAANSVDYLAAHNSPSIAQHYWSLSVEEQFYIAWPLLMVIALVLARRARPRGVTPRRLMAGILLVVTFASFAYSIIETIRSQPSAYFITTTRAWEFAIGGLVAMLPTVAFRGRWHIGVSWISLLTIIGCAVLFDATTAFPGWIALIPVAATAILLVAGDSSDHRSPQFLARFAPVRLVGDASYSIYLWHWPIIVLFIAIEGRSPGWKWSIAIAIVTVILAVLTKRFIEDPVRQAPGFLQRNRFTFIASAASMAIVAALALTPIAVAREGQARLYADVERSIDDVNGCFGAYAIANSCPQPFAAGPLVDAAFTASDGYNDRGPVSSDACDQSNVRGRLEVRCLLSQPADPVLSVAAIGDSHTDHFAAPLQKIAIDNGWAMQTHRRSGCSGFAVSAPTASDPGCADWGYETIAQLAEDQTVDVVLIAIRAVLYDEDFERAAATSALSTLIESGKRVAVIRTVPGMEAEWPVRGTAESGPECVERTEGNDPCAWTPPTESDWLLDVSSSLGIPIIDTWEIICPDGKCHSVIGDTIIYFDDNHLATSFARTLAPWLEDQLRSALTVH